MQCKKKQVKDGTYIMTTSLSSKDPTPCCFRNNTRLRLWLHNCHLHFNSSSLHCACDHPITQCHKLSTKGSMITMYFLLTLNFTRKTLIINANHNRENKDKMTTIASTPWYKNNKSLSSRTNLKSRGKLSKTDPSKSTTSTQFGSRHFLSLG